MKSGIASFVLALACLPIAVGCGSSSDSGTNDTGGSAPGAVTGLVVTPGDGANTLTWRRSKGGLV